VTVTIAVITSGGDAPGMNSAIAGIAEEAERRDLRVLAVHGGYRGLAERRISELTLGEARRHMPESGTWLQSSRFPELRTPDRFAQCQAALRSAGADAVAVIGGGGSLQGARLFAAAGTPVAFLPATIDNDIAGTAVTIGLDSAVNYAVSVTDRLRVTGRSLPGRAFVLQTLGGPTGHLALAVASAAGVDDVLVPGRSFDLDRVAQHFAGRADMGEAIAIISEGVGNAVEVAAELGRRSGLRVHPAILGHAQRAADPSSLDRQLGLSGGRAACALLARRQSAFVAFTGNGVPTPLGLHHESLSKESTDRAAERSSPS
jgi:6-phosphofructokinase 1